MECRGVGVCRGVGESLCRECVGCRGVGCRGVGESLCREYVWCRV